MIYKCKYCKAETEHIHVSTSEKNGLPASVCKCYVCSYEKLVYRERGRLVVDESGVPDRIVLLPYDKEYLMNMPTTQTEENAHKEIDNWLKCDELWLGWSAALEHKKRKAN